MLERAYGVLWQDLAQESTAICRICPCSARGTRNELGFFFTQAEKSSLYAEKFADIISKDTDPASLQPYFDARLDAGTQSMMWVDLMSYLPDDILVKVDRMSMACSLEVRVPLLDHKVVEFMAQVEKKQKYTQFNNKILLRDLAQRYLPQNILQRPKQGFAIPLASWLQRELKPMVDEVLAPTRMRQRGLFDPDHVERMVTDHQQGRRDYSQQLWAILMLELWLERLIGSKAAV